MEVLRTSPPPPIQFKLTSSFQCSKSIYPFHDGAFEDFEPIFQKLIDVSPQLTKHIPNIIIPINPGKHQRRLFRRLHQSLHPDSRRPRNPRRTSNRQQPPRPSLRPLPPRRSRPPHLPLPLRKPIQPTLNLPQARRLQPPKNPLPKSRLRLETNPKGRNHPPHPRLQSRWTIHPHLRTRPRRSKRR